MLSSLENLHEESNSSANVSVVPKKKESISSKKNSIDSTTSVLSSLGELHFKLKYSYEKRSLSVVIVRAEGLPPMKGEGSQLDPYVKLQLLPEKQHKVFITFS